MRLRRRADRRGARGRRAGCRDLHRMQRAALAAHRGDARRAARAASARAGSRSRSRSRMRAPWRSCSATSARRSRPASACCRATNIASCIEECRLPHHPARPHACGRVHRDPAHRSHADTYYISVAPHNPGGPICTAAAMHLAAAIPNFFILEQMEPQREFRDRASQPAIRFEDGQFLLPEGPGLGIEPALEVIGGDGVPAATAIGAARRALSLTRSKTGGKHEASLRLAGPRGARRIPACRGPAAAADPVVLQWQTANLVEKQFEPIWKQMIAEFEAANPGVKIEPVLVARKDDWTRFVTAAQARRAPCIVETNTDPRRGERLSDADRQVLERRARGVPQRMVDGRAQGLALEGTSSTACRSGAASMARSTTARWWRRPGSTRASRRQTGTSTSPG